jgi:Flp pilus assembly protein TadG
MRPTTVLPSSSARRVTRTAQRGVAAVELAIISVVFFTLIFGIIEFARAMYMINTLAVATQQAARLAANTDWRDDAAMDQVRQQAIFRTTSGGLVWGDPITDRNVRIDYLALTRQSDGSLTESPVTAMPSCPSRNRQNCIADPNGASCIRLVRARICDTANTSSCDPVAFQPIVSLVPIPLQLPTSPTIVAAQSLGYQAGAPVCP